MLGGEFRGPALNDKGSHFQSKSCMSSYHYYNLELEKIYIKKEFGDFKKLTSI